MRVGLQIRDDLVRGNSRGYGGMDGCFRNFGGDEVGVARVEAGEEGEYGYG